MRYKGAMKATTIAHLTGRMDAILRMMEFRIQKIKMEDHQAEYLMGQIDEAKAANDEIFEMYKKSELDKVKKTFNDEDK